MKGNKLFVVVREDMELGAITCQAVHAARLFVSDHPTEDKAWFDGGGNLAVLGVNNELELMELERKIEKAGFKSSMFYEEDFGEQATALAVEPAAWKLLSSLRKLHRGKKLETEKQAA